MRQAKFLTLSAVVGLSLISGGNSAHAAPVNFQGTVASSCTLTTADPIDPLSDNGDSPVTALVGLSGNTRGTVIVTCNDSTKSLKLEIDNASSVVYNGTAKIRFNGGGGVFGTGNTPAAVSSTAFTVAIPSPTAAAGDTGRIQLRIDAPTSGLLQAANNYKLVVKATIVP